MDDPYVFKILYMGAVLKLLNFNWRPIFTDFNKTKLCKPALVYSVDSLTNSYDSRILLTIQYKLAQCRQVTRFPPHLWCVWQHVFHI